MSLWQKILLGLLVLELAAAAAIGLKRNQVLRLPEVNWALLEEPLAKEVQAQEAALALEPRSVAPWLELGETYFSFGLFPQAEYCFEQVDKREPAVPAYLNGWGLILGRMVEPPASGRNINASWKCWQPILHRTRAWLTCAGTGSGKITCASKMRQKPRKPCGRRPLSPEQDTF